MRTRALRDPNAEVVFIEHKGERMSVIINENKILKIGKFSDIVNELEFSSTNPEITFWLEGFVTLDNSIAINSKAFQSSDVFEPFRHNVKKFKRKEKLKKLNHGKEGI